MRATSLLALALLGTLLIGSGVRVAAAPGPALSTAPECAVDDIIPDVLYLEEDDVMLTSACLGPGGENLPRFQAMDCDNADYTLGGTDYWILQEDGGGGSGADHTDKQLCPQAECDENGGCTGCDECVEGTCVSACLDGETCDTGSCVPIDPCATVSCGACESCLAGSCSSYCGDGEVCDIDGITCAPADPCAGVACGPCESCAGGACFSDCNDNEICDADEFGGAVCVPTDPCGGTCLAGCEECVIVGPAVYACSPTAGSEANQACPNYDACAGVTCGGCESCAAGACVSDCGDNQSCDDDGVTCVDNDPCTGVTCGPCEACAGGVCGTYCTGSETCDFDGFTCVETNNDPCGGDPCCGVPCCGTCTDGQTCQNNVCVDNDPCGGACQGPCDVCGWDGFVWTCQPTGDPSCGGGTGCGDYPACVPDSGPEACPPGLNCVPGPSAEGGCCSGPP